MIDMNEWCNRLIVHEGLRLKPYRCPRGKLTIGVGRNLEDNPLTTEEKKALGDYMHGITENGAKMLLRHDIKKSYAAAQKTVGNFENLTPDRQYALTDMCFQLGAEGVLKFKNMLAAINKELYGLAAVECLKSDYAKQTPKRAKRIAETIRTGKWQYS